GPSGRASSNASAAQAGAHPRRRPLGAVVPPGTGHSAEQLAASNRPGTGPGWVSDTDPAPVTSGPLSAMSVHLIDQLDPTTPRGDRLLAPNPCQRSCG